MIEKLIERGLKTRDDAHKAHWSTDSYSEHVVLGAFYEDLINQLDKYVEAHQGAFGRVGKPSKDIKTKLQEDVVWLTENRDKLANNIKPLENMLDEMVSGYLSTLYKLENLR